MKCSSCGADVPEGAVFCPNCGTRLEEQKEQIEQKEQKEQKGKKPLFGFNLNREQIKDFAQNATKKGGDALKKAGEVLSDKAAEVKDAAVDVKEDITAKLTELDRMLESSITEYNDVYTLMNDKGVQLYIERCRAIDTISNVELLINSIANHPKSFDTDFEEINTNRKEFQDACEFAERELQAARTAAGGAGAGIAAGATVAFMAPTAAMWIATTFGVASTGTAISTLTGAAATNAALAWLGGGALTAGGAGIAGGNALLALAGPIGWTIAGATLLTSILLFAKKRVKLNKEKNEEIEAVKRNIEQVREMDGQILEILTQTAKIRSSLNDNYHDCMPMFGGDYSNFADPEKMKLGAMVNLTKALAALYGRQVRQELVQTETEDGAAGVEES